MDKIRKPLLLLLLVLVLFLMYLTQPASAAEYPAWSGASVVYATGDIVTYGGSYYECLQNHTSNAGWSPTTAKTLWKQIAAPPDPTVAPEPTPKETTAPSPATPTPSSQELPNPSVSPEPLPEDSESFIVLFMGVLAGLIMALIWAWSARRL